MLFFFHCNPRWVYGVFRDFFLGGSIRVFFFSFRPIVIMPYCSSIALHIAYSSYPKALDHSQLRLQSRHNIVSTPNCSDCHMVCVTTSELLVFLFFARLPENCAIHLFFHPTLQRTALWIHFFGLRLPRDTCMDQLITACCFQSQIYVFKITLAVKPFVRNLMQLISAFGFCLNLFDGLSVLPSCPILRNAPTK